MLRVVFTVIVACAVAAALPNDIVTKLLAEKLFKPTYSPGAVEPPTYNYWKILAQKLHKSTPSSKIIVEATPSHTPLELILEELLRPAPKSEVVVEEFCAPPPPPYTSSKILIEHLVHYIRKKFHFVEPSPTQRSFVAVKLVVNMVGEGLALGLDYDSAYSTHCKIVKLGQAQPCAARDLLTAIEKKQLKEQAGPIMELITEVCGHHVENSDWCDQQIDLRVRSNIELQAPATMLLALGSMAERFDEWIPDAEKVSHLHIEEQYLSKSKHALKPLIFALGEVYKASNCMA